MRRVAGTCVLFQSAIFYTYRWVRMLKVSQIKILLMYLSIFPRCNRRLIHRRLNFGRLCMKIRTHSPFFSVDLFVKLRYLV
jgi:hypothetical protein